MASSAKEDYKKIIETLPKERHFRLYGGFWFSDLALPGLMHFQKFFNPRSTDIYLMTYPKSGTTWIKSLVFSILNRNSFSFKNHPLLTTHPHKLVPNLQEHASLSSDLEWELLPSPRLFASHIPYSLLPDSMIKNDNFGCKMIYVARDPKDAFISLYFFLKEVRKHESLPFDEAFADFCEGYAPWGSIWDHQMEYKRESLKRPHKVRVLNYEEMKESPGKHVRRIAEFLGKPFSEEEERGGVVEEIVKLCSFEFLTELEVNTKGINLQIGHLIFKNAAYFRKGKVGDWKEHLTVEMAERIDTITQQKQLEHGLI